MTDRCVLAHFVSLLLGLVRLFTERCDFAQLTSGSDLFSRPFHARSLKTRLARTDQSSIETRSAYVLLDAAHQQM